MDRLHIDIVRIINSYNTATDQKALKCTCKYFSDLETQSYYDEIMTYALDIDKLNVVHKENPLYFTTKYFWKDRTKIGIIKNISWFGVSGIFNVYKGTYYAKLVGTFYNPALDAGLHPYKIKFTLNGIVKNLKIFHYDNSNGLMKLEIGQSGQLKIEIDEHVFLKKQMIIIMLFCIPAYLYEHRNKGEMNKRMSTVTI